MLPSYPKVYTLGHRYLKEPNLFSDSVVVQEKIDGSQISFGVLDGVLHVRSSGAVINPEAPPSLFAAGVKYLLENQAKLQPGYIYRGECLSKPKHGVLAYGRIPKNHIIIYDIEEGPSNFVEYKNLEQRAAEIGLESVSILWAGVVEDQLVLQGMLDKWLETESLLGGSIEGVVIKPLHRNLWGMDKKMLVGKYVSPQFKEKHQTEWKPGEDPIHKLGQELCSEARWQKAVQHLAEEGKLLGDPKDIGQLVHYVQQDVFEEETEWIKDRLFATFKKGLQRDIVRGLPEWYKNQLLTKQLGGKDE